MISNSIRTGSLRERERARLSTRLFEEKCVCQIIYVIHTSQPYRIVSNYVDIIDRFYIHIQRRTMVSHTFLPLPYSYIYIYIYIYTIQLITFVLWQGFLHLLLCMVIRQHTYESKPIPNQDDYSSYFFIFALKTISRKKIEHRHLLQHENKQSNWTKAICIYMLFPYVLEKKNRLLLFSLNKKYNRSKLIEEKKSSFFKNKSFFTYSKYIIILIIFCSKYIKTK